MTVDRGQLTVPSIKIINEDNHLLVVEKPVNVLSQGDDTGDADFLSFLKQYIKDKYNKPGEVYLGLVHRLDRPVGGVMVFARTSKSASRLSEQIRNKEFIKTYLAIIHGIPEIKAGRLTHHLIKDGVTNTVTSVNAGKEGSKEAILDYEVLASKAAFSLVRINLQTGRSHQIRVQFATIGHALYGDQKYGLGQNKAGQQIGLWAHMVCFKHPTVKQELVFKSLPPNEYPWNLFKTEI